jgi:thiol-disulfide isomerase/thioredoxin
MTRIHTSFWRILASVTLLGVTCTPSWAKPAPLIQYLNVQGDVEMPDYKKCKLTAVHFWATWCTPCVDELPEVDAALQTYSKAGLCIIPISLDNSLDKVMEFYKNFNIRALPAYGDDRMQSFGNLGIRGLPTTVFIDRRGTEIDRVEGPMHWNKSPNKEFIEKHLGTP